VYKDLFWGFIFYMFLCKQPFSIDTNFSWAGAGSAVFGNPAKQQASTKGKDENESSDDEHCADDTVNSSHDPHFEPIIDLPDKVEVRTGEEDETKGWWLLIFSDVLCDIHLMQPLQYGHYKYSCVGVCARARMHAHLSSDVYIFLKKKFNFVM
jgi:hypothetical protein